MPTWPLYDPHISARARKVRLPTPPRWRRPGSRRAAVIAATFCPTAEVIEAVNAALFLRRPLLVTGRPGTGKSSLIRSVAANLNLGEVLVWSINSRSTLQEGLYDYDALGRLQHLQEKSVRSGGVTVKPLKNKKTERNATGGIDEDSTELGMFLKLGPLGSALASSKSPRALLVDEIDKSDIDLPNDLLNVLDTGQFSIRELQRIARQSPVVSVDTVDGESVPIKLGQVTFTEYPFIVMTSNGEREFPAPFLRRCIQCPLPEPNLEELQAIVAAHFESVSPRARALIDKFIGQRQEVALATDQLLNAVHLLDAAEQQFDEGDEERLLKMLFRGLR
jgi:MoxR-like ATPase